MTRRAEVVFAAARLFPALGGAEQFALELLEALARRHRVRALWLDDGAPPVGLAAGVVGVRAPTPPYPEAYWQARSVQRRALRAAVRAELHVRPADVVVTHHHGGPGAVAAATEAGVPTILLLPSYESLCKLAYEPATACLPLSRCGECPRARAMPRAERRELECSRAEHEVALARATELLAPSAYVAGQIEAWSGRRPHVLPPVVARPRPAGARADGHALLAPAMWLETKGLGLVEALAGGIRGRRVRLTRAGLPEPTARRLESLAHVELVEHGPIDRLLAGAGLVLVPSQWPEPFGRIAFEAMAAGVPTLASGHGGLAGFVPHDQLVTAYDEPEAWLAAVRSLDDAGRWERAQVAGLAAAGAVLAADTPRAFAILVDDVLERCGAGTLLGETIG